VFPFKYLHPNAGALLRKQILLLDPSLHNFHEGDEFYSDFNMQSTRTTNPSVSPVPQVVQGAGQQNITAGENLSRNAALSRSGGSFSFSGENSGGTPSQTDSLGGSPSGSAPDLLDHTQSA
jgi:hypothetical protein